MPPKLPLKRDNYLLPPQNDLRVLKKLLQYCRYIGVAPFTLEENNLKSFTVKSTVVIFLSFYIVCECISYKLQIEYEIEEDINANDKIFVPMKIIWSLSNTLFLVITVAQPNLFQLNEWKRLIAIVEEVEVVTVKCNFKMRRNAFFIYSQSISYVAITIISHIYHIIDLVFIERPYKIFAYLGWAFSHFYMSCVMSLFHLLVKIVKLRYVHLSRELEFKDGELVLNILTILNCCEKLHFLTDAVNDIFGLQLFLCIFLTFVFNVSLLSYVLLDPQKAEPSLVFILLLFTIVYLVTLFMTIMACDSVECSARSIIKTCYDLHERVEDEFVKEQLMDLAKYLKQCRPAFSAAGFFYVNQKTLPAFLWAIIQYLVIVIQFSLATSEAPTVREE